MTEHDFDSGSVGGMPLGEGRGVRVSRLRRELADELQQSHQQRRTLFRFILAVVGLALLISIGFVTALGTNLIAVETPVAVAFIGATAIQSFVLIGLIVRGLFSSQGPHALRPELGN